MPPEFNEIKHEENSNGKNAECWVGFRWSRYQGIWYAKDSSYSRQIASELADQGEAERQRALAKVIANFSNF